MGTDVPPEFSDELQLLGAALIEIGSSVQAEVLTVAFADPDDPDPDPTPIAAVIVVRGPLSPHMLDLARNHRPSSDQGGTDGG